ncbi:PH domain containing protein [Pseudohyphozyma bogoriensis]|nr:PH domain containing protein [Pseudohyphozyma bogoriensis]
MSPAPSSTESAPRPPLTPTRASSASKLATQRLLKQPLNSLLHSSALPTLPTKVRTEPPTDPAGAGERGPRPAQVLVKRLNEVARIAGSLEGYFGGLTASHVAQAKAMATLSGPNTIHSLLEASKDEAEQHKAFAHVITTEINPPLANLSKVLHEQARALEAEIDALVDAVVRERSNFDASISHLAKALSTLSKTPTTLPSSLDPVLAREAAEQHGKQKIEKENELLTVSFKWQEKVRDLEVSGFVVVKACLAKWREARSNHLGALEDGYITLMKEVAALAPDVEWKHFVTLNQLLPTSLPRIDSSDISYPGRDDASTTITKQGSLERRKRFDKQWKAAHYVLTPSGYLHEYRSPSSPLTRPLHSLFLPHFTLSPLIESIPTQPGSELTAAQLIQKAATAVPQPERFVLQTKAGVNGVGAVRELRSDDLVGIKEWWEAIGKFTKGATAKDAANITESSREELEFEEGEDDDESFADARKQEFAAEDTSTPKKSLKPGDMVKRV